MLANETIGKMEFDNLIYSTQVTILTGTRTLAAGQGDLKRGTALAMTEDGELVVLGTADATASCILTDDVAANAAAQSVLVYLAGQFNTNALAVVEGYTITDADIEDFRSVGIYLETAVS